MCTQTIYRSLLGILFTFFAVFSTTKLYSQIDFVKGRILYYSCDDINVLNQSLNRLPHTDAILNGVTLSLGKEDSPNTAYYFNGKEGYIRLPNAPQSEQLGISFWFQSRSVNNSSTLMGYEEGAYWIGLTKKGDIEVTLNVSSYKKFHFQSEDLVGEKRNYDDGKWHHLILNFSETLFEIFIDGESKDKQIVNAATPLFYYQNQSTLHIGSLPEQTSFFNGLIDEVMVYNRPLSFSENRILFQAKNIEFIKSGQAGLIVHTAFEHEVLVNESHSRVNETIGDCQITGKLDGVGKISSKKCAKFNGIDDVIIFNNRLQLPQLSFGCWINTNSSQKSYVASWETDGFSILLNPDTLPTGYLVAQMKLTSNQTINLTVNEVLNDGKWHHIMMTFDNNRFTLYCDGKMAKKKELQSDMPKDILYQIKSRLIIGGKTSADNAYFDGRIDELLIYNYALTPKEVTKIYRSNLKPKTSSDIQSHFFTKSITRDDNKTMFVIFNKGKKHTIQILNNGMPGKKRKVASKYHIEGEISMNVNPKKLEVKVIR